MFVTDLETRAVGFEREFILTADLVWETSVERIVIPEGFRTDFYSVTFLGKLIAPNAAAKQAPAVLHDYLFVIQDRSRSAVDSLFLDAMAACRINWLQRMTIYSAVRIGGWMPWNHNERMLTHDPIAFLASHGLRPAESRLFPYGEIDRLDV